MPLKMVPLNSSAPVEPPRWIETLCGVPASLLSNTIWNGTQAGAVTVACSYLMPSALIITRLGLPDPPGSAGALADAAVLGAAVLLGAGAYVHPALAVVQALTTAAT